MNRVQTESLFVVQNVQKTEIIDKLNTLKLNIMYIYIALLKVFKEASLLPVSCNTVTIIYIIININTP